MQIGTYVKNVIARHIAQEKANGTPLVPNRVGRRMLARREEGIRRQREKERSHA